MEKGKNESRFVATWVTSIRNRESWQQEQLDHHVRFPLSAL